jgi:hypothetical protein
VGREDEDVPCMLVLELSVKMRVCREAVFVYADY